MHDDRREPMDETQLLALLRSEDTDASAVFSSELAADQDDAMQRYLGKPYGDEVEGHSRVVSRDLEDTINWLLPDLMRVFLSSDDLVSAEATNPADDAGAQCVEQVLPHVFFADNPGDRIVHDFAFDGLLQRIGIIHCTWAEPEARPPRMLEGLAPEQVQRYAGDPEYKILAAEQGQDGTFSLEVQHTPRFGRVRIEVVPPEEFALARRTKSLDDGDYHRRKRLVYAGDLGKLYPDRAIDLASSGGKDVEIELDARRNSRFSDEPNAGLRELTIAEARRKVVLIEEFLRVDYDGDGVPELRHIKRVGDTILENIEVERTEFFAWSPIRMSHKLVGRSMADVLIDLQRIRTVLMRRSLDSLAQSLNPRTVVNTARAATSTIDDLLDNVTGGVIEVTGDVREAVTALATPDIAASAFQMLEYMDQRVEQASGVNRQSQGIDPDVLNKTASGIMLLQAAASARVELIARWLAKGLEPVFQHVLHLLCRHQDGARLVKIKGKPVAVDPRTWDDEMAITLHVGVGAESRQQRVANLGMILQKQEAIIAQAGMSNPLVTPAHYRATLARMCEAMGFKDSAQFFAEVGEGPAPAPEPQKDPKLIEAETRAQVMQQESQNKLRLAEQEFAHKAAMAKADRDLERWKVEATLVSEREIAELRVREEMRIAEMRASAEMELSRWKEEQRAAIRREEIAAGGKPSGGDDGGSYRPGGRLDA